MNHGEQIATVAFAPFMGWLFRSKIRFLSLCQHGLVVERGTGTNFIPWSAIERLIAGIADRVSTKIENTSLVYSTFEICYGNEQTVRAPSRVAKLCVDKMASHIIKNAKLEWFYGTVNGRPLPPMAVKPEVAENLRASLKSPGTPDQE